MVAMVGVATTAVVTTAGIVTMVGDRPAGVGAAKWAGEAGNVPQDIGRRDGAKLIPAYFVELCLGR